MGSATLQRSDSPQSNAGSASSGVSTDTLGRKGRGSKRGRGGKNATAKKIPLRLRFKRDWQMLLLMIPGLLNRPGVSGGFLRR